MRSTLLFVVVLLACTPVRAPAEGPVQAPVLNAWLTALLPAPHRDESSPAAKRVTRRLEIQAPDSNTSDVAAPLRRLETFRHSIAAGATHDSNAP